MSERTLLQAIEHLERYLAVGCPEGTVQRDTAVQELGWLRELRARRIRDGREPDDERNAPRDLCCCFDLPRPPDYDPEPQFADGCPLHPDGEGPPPLDPFSVAEEAAAEMAEEGLTPSLAEFRAGRGWWDGEEPAPGTVEVLWMAPRETEVIQLAAEVERLRETLRELTTCDFIGDVQEKLHTLEPWLFEGEEQRQP